MLQHRAGLWAGRVCKIFSVLFRIHLHSHFMLTIRMYNFHYKDVNVPAQAAWQWQTVLDVSGDEEGKRTICKSSSCWAIAWITNTAYVNVSLQRTLIITDETIWESSQGECYLLRYVMRNSNRVNKKSNILIYFFNGCSFDCKAQKLSSVHPFAMLWPRDTQSIIWRNIGEPCCNLSAPLVP